MSGLHEDKPLSTAETPLEGAEAALVSVHGRGASARSILEMSEEVHREGLALVAPQAEGNSWYPNSFLAPVEENEPGRSSGLRAVGEAVETATDAGVPVERVLLFGFSQGACLAAEYVARNPRRYGGVSVLSGGLIGESVDRDDYEGDLAGTPAFFGCSDVDPHIPEERVHASAEVFEELDGEVTVRIYEGMSHGVNEDELEVLEGMVERLFA